MHPEDNLNKLKVTLNEIIDLTTIRGLVQWDQETYMPTGGSLGRSYQLSALSKIIHLKTTSPENGQLLEELKPYAATLDPDSDDARLIKVTARHYERRTKVPVEWVAEFARVTGEAYKVWEKARAESDFASFQPFLKRIVELRREYASFFTPYDHVYDPLLDEFEPGMKTVDVQEIFAWLRPRQVALIKEISGRPQVDDSFLHQPFPEKAQWDFGVEVITRFGYDWNRGRQDKTAHPFTQSMG
jgi:carboxypeptidase Taq